MIFKRPLILYIRIPYKRPIGIRISQTNYLMDPGIHLQALFLYLAQRIFIWILSRSSQGMTRRSTLPIPFVLAMDYLSALLNFATLHSIISYHPRCKGLGLTHLCFADDLLIFMDGTTSSVTDIMRVLTQFHQHSGLKLNSKNLNYTEVVSHLGLLLTC